MNKINNLLRDLRVTVNSESHTANEWVAILQQLQEVGQKASIRFQLERGIFAEVVEEDETLIESVIDKEKP